MGSCHPALSRAARRRRSRAHPRAAPRLCESRREPPHVWRAIETSGEQGFVALVAGSRVVAGEHVCIDCSRGRRRATWEYFSPWDGPGGVGAEH